MRTILATLPLALSLLAGNLDAQVIPAKRMGTPTQRPQKTPEQLRALYEKEIAEPFVAKGSWVVDYDEARARAKRENKLIFAYFSRSYAG